MTAIERIKEIEAGDGEWGTGDVVFLLKAFRVMREIAILDAVALIHPIGKIDDLDRTEADKSIDQEFEERMMEMPNHIPEVKDPNSYMKPMKTAAEIMRGRD